MSDLPFVLRDHREQLWRAWVDALDERVSEDYRRLVASPLGDRMVRTFVEDLVAWHEAEEYQRPGLLRDVDRRAAAEAAHRRTLGFADAEMAAAWSGLRRAVVTVLLDALVLGELPSFGQTLEQLREIDAMIDRLVVAAVAGGVPAAGDGRHDQPPDP